MVFSSCGKARSHFARVAELVDALALGASLLGGRGSSPLSCTSSQGPVFHSQLKQQILQYYKRREFLPAYVFRRIKSLRNFCRGDIESKFW